MQINCSASSLFIGTGTANSIVGLTTGVTPAGTTTTTVNVALDINDIVDKINTATISGLTASNSNNRLKLTSNNSTLVIGAGTSNATVGLSAQTYTAATSVVSNVFNAIVNGIEQLSPAILRATDLRASVSLILAGLASSGETVISRVYHLDRGYENIEKKLSDCGADIKRIR